MNYSFTSKNNRYASNPNYYNVPNSRPFLEHIKYLKIIHEPPDVDVAVEEIYRKCKLFPVIGMDCEWTATRQKNQKPDVALLQIATKDGWCVLFRTCFMSKVPASLVKLLADPAVMKVGVGIYSDGKFLKQKFKNLEVKSLFDLRYFSRLCNVFSRNETLKELTKALLPFELQKENVLTFNWEREKLDDEMVQYAALDALAGILIFEKLLPLFHEQESEEPFHSTSRSELIKRYFTDRDSPCYQFLDTKL
jgi:ribonuclease D